MTNLTLEEKKELIRMALAAREKAYVPYSDFMVGAALRAKDGRIFTGCNVENAAFTPTSCAERTALFKAVAEGVTAFTDIAVVGTAVGLERDLVPQAGFELETIEKVPFPRRPNKAALQFPAKWKAEKAKVRDILTRHQAQVVVGFGGYTSAPVYAAAHSMGIPIAIHEQNARAGMANKLGARWASMIGAAYAQPGLKPRRGVEVERVGLPLRPCRRTP